MFYFSQDHLVHGLHIEVPPPHHVRHSRIPLSIVQAPTPGDWMGTNLCKIEKCISFTSFATLEYKTQALTMWFVSWKSFHNGPTFISFCMKTCCIYTSLAIFPPSVILKSRILPFQCLAKSSDAFPFTRYWPRLPGCIVTQEYFLYTWGIHSSFSSFMLYNTTDEILLLARFRPLSLAMRY